MLAIYRDFIGGVFSGGLKIDVALSDCFASSVDRKDGTGTVLT